jgi:glycosyltransferase involved in cell wall biosynthesis
MSKKVRISVLMAVYNTDFLLFKRAVDSVMHQSFQDFELLIIDDGSNNDPYNQLLAYAKQHEPKISYLRHANRGQSASINRGLLNSTGDYVTIIDSDDEYKPGHLEACLREMQYADLIASTTETVVDHDDDYHVVDRHDPNRLIHVDDCILFATLFGRREVFTDLTFHDRYGADAHFYERAAQKYTVRKVDLRTYIYYRNIPGSICSFVKKQLQTALA